MPQSREIELSKAISMPGSLMNTTGSSLDVRYVAKNETDRISIPQASRYVGLQVYQTDTKTLYVLKDNSTKQGTWEKVAISGLGQDLQAKNVTVSQSILPTTNGQQDIGSPDKRFRSIYVDEAYLSTNTLYIGDTPILGTSDDTVMIKADPDQSINLKTSGSGTSKITSQSTAEISTSGMNADVVIQASGQGSMVRASATQEVRLEAPDVSLKGDVSIAKNLTVAGDVTIKGSTFEVDATTVTTKDNIIVLNKGEVGSGVTKGSAGIQVDRGDAPDYQFVFDEKDDMFKVGIAGNLETVATRPYVDSGLAGKANASHSHSNATTSASGFMSNTDKSKLDGIAANSTKVEKSSTNGNIKINGTETAVYVHPAGTNPHGTTKADVGLGNVPNVATNDQTPTFTASSTLANLVSGEKLSSMLGKVSKAISDLSGHISNRSNPHGVTASQIGAETPSGAQAKVDAHANNKEIHITAAERELWNNGTQGPKGDKGDKGDTGATGAAGKDGAAATITVGTVTTGAAGTNATVTNAGTSSAAVFNFAIPRGATGAQGPQGPQGAKGEQGIQGIQGIQGPKGDKGDTGATGPQGPKGDTGATGPQGVQGVTPTIKAGTVTTGSAGTDASVTASTSGTTTTFNFTIPRGATGAQGPKGDTGATGPQGVKGDKGDTGAQGPQGLQGPAGADGLTTSVTVNGTRYSHSNGNITLPNYPTLSSLGAAASSHTHSAATSSAAGFMSAADKAKLDGIAAGANNYVHPSTHDASMIVESATKRFVSDTEKSTWNAKETTSGSQAKADAALNSAKSYTDSKVAALVNSAPEALDTLGELATAIQEHEDAYDSLLATVGSKADKTYVDSELAKKANSTHTHTIANITNLQSSLDAKANLASPALTGTPTAPTASAGTNTTQVATTAFVTTAINNKTSVSGNAGTATKLQTARTINGTSFDGSANITTANWGTARTLTIGNSGKSVNGSGNVSWSLSEIGAAAASHTHNYDQINSVKSMRINKYSDENTSGSLSAMDQLLVNQARANRTAFTPASAITVEYSTDGGTTWSAYSLSDTEKMNLFSMNGASSVRLGGPDTSATVTTSMQVRITVSPTDRYANVNQFYCWFNTSGHTCVVDIERSTIGEKTTFTKIRQNVGVSGWSGPNMVNFTSGTYGGGTNQTSNFYSYRFTFKVTAVSSSYPTSKPTVTDLRMYGDSVWTVANNAMSKDYIYSWDSSQNVTFPAKVTASSFSGSFSGSLSGNASTATKLATARTINGVAFDGTANITVADSTKLPLTGGTLTGALTTSAVIQDNRITTGNKQLLNAASNMIYVGNPGTNLRLESSTNPSVTVGSNTHVLYHAGNPQTSVSGNAGTATKLATARTINGTSFDGSANITTANWGTARTLTIGNTGKSVNGSGNISWTLAEIGALPLSGGTISSANFGALVVQRSGTSNGSAIAFSNSNGVLGYVGMTGSANGGLLRYSADTNSSYTVLDTGNFKTHITPSAIGAAASSHTHTIANITNLQTTLDAKAPLASPALTGTPTAPTAAAGTNSTQLATTAFVTTAVNNKTSVTGNAGTATKLQTARTINGVAFDGSANITVADSTKLPLSGGTLTGRLTANGKITATTTAGSWISGMTLTNATIGISTQQTTSSYHPILAVKTSGGHVANIGGLGDNFGFYGFRSGRTENATDWSFVFNASTGDVSATGRITASGGFSGALSGNATTATTLQTARTINGTSFNGSANITTAQWGTARTLTIGNSAKSVNGSANVSWSLSEIGAASTAVATTSANGLMSSSDKSKLDSISDITTITKTLKVTTSWQDVGITGSNLATGSYMLQMVTANGTAGFYNEMFTGTMSWFASATNNTDADEIVLHKAGHASGGHTLYLRTIRSASSGYLKLQIAASKDLSASDLALTFKFRKLI